MTQTFVLSHLFTDVADVVPNQGPVSRRGLAALPELIEQSSNLKIWH